MNETDSKEGEDKIQQIEKEYERVLLGKFDIFLDPCLSTWNCESSNMMD